MYGNRVTSCTYLGPRELTKNKAKSISSNQTGGDSSCRPSQLRTTTWWLSLYFVDLALIAFFFLTHALSKIHPFAQWVAYTLNQSCFWIDVLRLRPELAVEICQLFQQFCLEAVIDSALKYIDLIYAYRRCDNFEDILLTAVGLCVAHSRHVVV